MIDSITTLYTAMEQSKQQTEVSTAVLAKSIDTVEQAGENLQGLIQTAGASASQAFTDPLVGQHINVTA
ncbi:Putative motility protein [Alkalispirochaeta americana]|uniref:Putative motility protein n=1 Tax=Alkalispirochaeta americana TaxID=159291 RepID=A0A1N6VC52_9SPIO|nr:YjfB family protein [Alkalispirochaeta americana]SIQ75434.1 Putative motility protein [Alkalispirochaeta americana]